MNVFQTTDVNFDGSIIRVQDVVDACDTAACISNKNMIDFVNLNSACLKKGIKPIFALSSYYRGADCVLVAKNNVGLGRLFENSHLVEWSGDTEGLFVCAKDIETADAVDGKVHAIGCTPENTASVVAYCKKNNCVPIPYHKAFATTIGGTVGARAKYATLNKVMIEECSHITQDHVLLNSEQMDKMFHPNIIANVHRLIDACKVELTLGEQNMPKLYKDADTKLEGHILSKSTNMSAKYQARCDYELGVIKKMGFSSYFLCVQEVCQAARGMGIGLGAGRGSAAGSLVCFLLGITAVDPIKHGLIFERFLNPDRIGLPDIDTDIDSNRRQDLLDWVSRRFGLKNTSGIMTVGRSGIKQSFLDAFRVMGRQPWEAAKINKLVPDDISSFDELIEQSPKIADISKGRYSKDFSIAKMLFGTARSIGCHAGGIIIHNQDITTLCPTYIRYDDRLRRDVVITGVTMNDAESLGLIKYDFLGLKNLSIISNFNKIKPGADMTNFNLEDKECLRLISSGNNAGLFQVETPAMIKACKKIKPKTFNDVSAILSLVRPATLQNGSVDLYAKYNNSDAHIDYKGDVEREVFSETYGIMLYQEQSMKIAVMMAGFSNSEADTLRKAIGKKDESLMIKVLDQFKSGAKEKGYPDQDIDRIIKDLHNAASYSFNKCLSGDEVLFCNNSNSKSKGRPNIRDMFKTMHDVEWAKDNDRRSLRGKYKREGYGTTISIVGNALKTNKIEEINFSGYREVFKVTLACGSTIKATSGHKFPTTNGTKPLSSLVVGDILPTKGDRVDAGKGQREYQILWSEIISIESSGVIDTYDITMAAPSHTLTNMNGVVSCNSHSVAYAFTTMKTAFLKTRFPVEFLAATMTSFIGDRYKLCTMYCDAMRIGISLLPPDVNNDKDYFSVESGAIRIPLNAMKGIGVRDIPRINSGEKML